MKSRKSLNPNASGWRSQGIHEAIIAVVLIALLFLIGTSMLGCTLAAPRSDSLDFPIYYLYPGEPAPVEGPQLRSRDFERLLKRL